MINIDLISFIDPIWVIGILGAVNSVQEKKVSTAKEKERLQLVTNIVRDDETAISLIEKATNSAFEYVSAVYSMERTLATQRHRLEGEAIRQLTESLDSMRKRKHDLLIDDIRIANRYIFKTFGQDIPEGGIYSGDPWDLTEGNVKRVAVGDWAGKLVYQYFDDRKK